MGNAGSGKEIDNGSRSHLDTYMQTRERDIASPV